MKIFTVIIKEISLLCEGNNVISDGRKYNCLTRCSCKTIFQLDATSPSGQCCWCIVKWLAEKRAFCESRCVWVWNEWINPLIIKESQQERKQRNKENQRNAVHIVIFFPHMALRGVESLTLNIVSLHFCIPCVVKGFECHHWAHTFLSSLFF